MDRMMLIHFRASGFKFHNDRSVSSYCLKSGADEDLRRCTASWYVKNI